MNTQSQSVRASYKPRPNPEPVTITLLAVGGIAALIAFIRARMKAGEEDEGTPLGGPPPDEEEPPNGGGGGGGGGGPAQGTDKSLTISNDCKTVVMGKDWLSDVAYPQIQSALNQGRGLSIYHSSNLDLSIDKVIREIVRPYNESCVDNSPWLDKYYSQNPPPKLSDFGTSTAYIQAYNAWDDAWDQQISSWYSSHQQLFNLYKLIGQVIVNGYADTIGVDLNRVPDQLDQVPSLTQDDITKLMALGYDIWESTVEDFQVDFNLVMDYRTNKEWSAEGNAIKEDNKIGPQTRNAIDIALALQLKYGKWPLLVQTAVNNFPA